MNKNLVYTSAFLSIILSCFACQETPDPCAALTPVSADFDMYDGKVKTDTFWGGPATIIFKAKDSTAQSYAWSFPNGENTSDKRQFFLTFHNETGLIPVQLILKNKPRTACFPKDDGVDTLQKSAFIIDYWDKPQWIGEFTGADDTNPNRKYTILIADFRLRPNEPQPTDIFYGGIRIYNFPEGCCTHRTTLKWAPALPKIGSTYKTFNYFEGTQNSVGCPAVVVDAFMENADKIVINYTVLVYEGNKSHTVKRRFIGYRKK